MPKSIEEQAPLNTTEFYSPDVAVPMVLAVGYDEETGHAWARLSLKIGDVIAYTTHILPDEKPRALDGARGK